MPQHIAANDNRLKWFGQISTEVTTAWVKPWRIPQEERGLYDINLVDRAAMPAGVRINFESDTSFIEISCDQATERTQVDLLIDGKLIASENTENTRTIRFDNLGTESKIIEIWLPQFGEFRFGGLTIDDNAQIFPFNASSIKKWVTYGSSITQCRTANSPTKTWPAIVARTRGYDLTCLGFGGQCHLDTMIARVIRDREADLISLCIGINIYGSGSLGQRTFMATIIGFVKIIREKHLTTPIVLLSPIYSPGRESTLNDVGFSLIQMREEVRRAVDALKGNGDKNISYINGLEVFDFDNVHLLPDDLHPDSEGYGIMAENLLRLLPTV